MYNMYELKMVDKILRGIRVEKKVVEFLGEKER